MSRLVAIIAIAFTVFSCGQQEPKTVSPDTASEQMKLPGQKPKLDSASILTMPTPIQVPALLRNRNATYDKSVLTPIQNRDKGFFEDNILFGMYITDLAYVSVYGDRQAVLNYFERCLDLADEIGLRGQIDQGLIDGFKRNVDRPDSLGRIILKVYDLGHRKMIDQERESLGLLMIMGCIYEGLHIGMSQSRDQDLITLVHLLNQQERYMSNLIYALSGYNIPDEVKWHHSHLLSLYELLLELDPPSVYEMRTGGMKLKTLDDSMLDKIEDNIGAFRRQMLQ
ncbi:MAG: hypothetical protein Kow0075_08070 [Salibacteraceae bacterium]